jgi:DNA polymerase I-like protein with 3'-5' exonuclease and polymerase domains
MVETYDYIIGHNIIGFDAPVVRSVWGVSIHRKKVLDTLVMSRLLNPQLEGGHSLKNWGKKLALEGLAEEGKGDFTDYDGGLCDEMIDYCVQDVKLTTILFNYLNKGFDVWKDKGEQALQLEHEVAIEITRQERNGFNLDMPKAQMLLATVIDKMGRIEQELQQVFKPITTKRVSEKTGKALKDKVTVFNVGSRKQIAERLESLGWKPKKFTDFGSVIVDETVLSELTFPEAKLIAEYLLLQKRNGLISSWIKFTANDGKVHGRCISNGAVTGRMTHHSPNLGQVPSTGSAYGKECRELFIPDSGHVLVGADLSGIELRCLAHYMQDDDYTREILEGDIHTKNQKSAGLETRSQAKTFIYATLYGAGATKIGSIVNGSAKDGKKLLDNFYKNTPLLAKLSEKVQRLASKGYIPALDGRRIKIRSEHAALNSLLQSCGAVIAKQWILEVHKLMRANGISFRQVAMVHDEIQASVPEEQAVKAGELMVEAAFNAGKTLKFRLPIAAEYAVGSSWLDTH